MDIILWLLLFILMALLKVKKLILYVWVGLGAFAGVLVQVLGTPQYVNIIVAIITFIGAAYLMIFNAPDKIKGEENENPTK